MRVQLIGKPESGTTGLSRYTDGLYRGLCEADLSVRLTYPLEAPVPTCIGSMFRRLGMDIRTFLRSYPVRADLTRADVYHLTGQMLATLLLFQPFPRPVIVTVLDIIPYLVQGVRELNTFRHPIDRLFYRLALTGLRRADALIAISAYTKQTLIEALGLPAERIHIVHLAVDPGKFHPMEVPHSFRERYGFDKAHRHLLYVGTEDPRKDLSTMIRAFAYVKQQMPGVKLLKVGAPRYEQEHQRLLSLVVELNLQADVRFLDHVPEEDLALFYNLADVCIMPSPYEGFGLPAVEAMACGTPLVCARAGALTEVVGTGGVQVDPHDAPTFAQAILGLLKSDEQRLHLRRAGQEQVAKFTWERMAYETQRLYRDLLANGNTA